MRQGLLEIFVELRVELLIGNCFPSLLLPVSCHEALVNLFRSLQYEMDLEPVHFMEAKLSLRIPHL